MNYSPIKTRTYKYHNERYANAIIPFKVKYWQERGYEIINTNIVEKITESALFGIKYVLIIKFKELEK